MIEIPSEKVDMEWFLNRFQPLVADVAAPQYGIVRQSGDVEYRWGDVHYYGVVPTISGLIVVYDGTA
jgi:hypothetical protein